jgi:hypothetical protein
MAGGDQFLYELAERAVLSSLKDPETIRYRQRVLGDCLQQPSVVRGAGRREEVWRWMLLLGPRSTLMP